MTYKMVNVALSTLDSTRKSTEFYPIWIQTFVKVLLKYAIKQI